MDRIEKFVEYREVHKRLLEKMVKFVDKNYSLEVVKAGRKLMFIIKNNRVIFTIDEFPFFMDYLLHEHRIEERTITELYKEKVGGENKVEEELIESMIESHVSLFKVVNVVQKKALVFLMDMEKRVKNIRLTDTELCDYAEDGMIQFTRIMKFDDFAMTSGMLFCFDGLYEKDLQDEIRRIKREIHNEEEQVVEIYNSIFDSHSMFLGRLKFIEEMMEGDICS